MFGLPPSHYKKWPVLEETFKILTTTKDRWVGGGWVGGACLAGWVQAGGS